MLLKDFRKNEILQKIIKEKNLIKVEYTKEQKKLIWDVAYRLIG